MTKSQYTLATLKNHPDLPADAENQLNSIIAEHAITGKVNEQKLWDMLSVVKGVESATRAILYVLLFLPLKSMAVFKGEERSVWAILKANMREPLNRWVAEARARGVSAEAKDLIKGCREMDGITFTYNPMKFATVDEVKNWTENSLKTKNNYRKL